MEKVLCNVFYEPVCHAMHTEKMSVNHNLGKFLDKKDAEKAVGIFFEALDKTKNQVGVSWYSGHKINQVYVPENQKTDHFQSVERFMITNPYVVFYLEKFYPSLLDSLRSRLGQSEIPNTTNEENSSC